MAWQNLGEELEELFGDRRPDLGLYSGEVSVSQFSDHRWRDAATLRMQRRVIAAKRKAYSEADRNRTYTVRKAVRAYQRGAVCANDVTGRFVKRTA